MTITYKLGSRNDTPLASANNSGFIIAEIMPDVNAPKAIWQLKNEKASKYNS